MKQRANTLQISIMISLKAWMVLLKLSTMGFTEATKMQIPMVTYIEMVSYIRGESAKTANPMKVACLSSHSGVNTRAFLLK